MLVFHVIFAHWRDMRIIFGQMKLFGAESFFSNCWLFKLIDKVCARLEPFIMCYVSPSELFQFSLRHIPFLILVYISYTPLFRQVVSSLTGLTQKLCVHFTFPPRALHGPAAWSFLMWLACDRIRGRVQIMKSGTLSAFFIKPFVDCSWSTSLLVPYWIKET